MQPLAVGADGRRVPQLERAGIDLLTWRPASPALRLEQRRALLRDTIEPMIQRELHHRGLIPDGGGYSARLIGWVELGARAV